MNATGEGTVRRTRRIGVMAGLIIMAALMAGCSSSSESSDAAYDTASEPAVSEEYASSAGDTAGSEGGAQDDSVGDGSQSPADQSLIVTGSLYMTVEDPLAAADQAVAIVQGAGGRIDARDETTPDEYEGGSASLVLRIPQDELDPTVNELRALGTVDHFATQSRDVSNEVTDLEATISTLRASTDRIQALLLEAQSIKDIITLEDELSRRQAELESLEARQRGLNDQVSMSTIELSLTTEPVVIVDDAPQTFVDGVTSGWDSLVTFVSGALVVTGVLLPWLALAAVITLVVIAVVRARRSRADRPAPASAATETAATTES
ncbi:DUF4349 domain-containing protein [Demequina sp. SO4-13]|uniref:DUF4349 domain-containing protein n=1 Tax=Demequina sp. SO4-13 TaxID=3401027 RepID=UPI003AF8563A